MPDVEQVLKALDCVKRYTKTSIETCKDCCYCLRAGRELFCDMPVIITDAITLIEDATATSVNHCADCQEWDCEGCKYKQ